MSIRNIKWLGLAVLIVLGSCARRPVADKPIKLEKRKLAELVHVMDSLTVLRPNSFYTKIKCNFSDTNRRISFKTSVRCIKDSIINPLITYLGIPFVNSIIRSDSLIISNRKDKCVIRSNMNFIKESFGVDFDYKNVEELLLGLPVAYDTAQRYFLINDPYNYIISSHRKRVIKKETKIKYDRDGILQLKKDRNENDDEDNNVLIRYYIDPSLKSIQKLVIDSPDDTTHIVVDYFSRDTVDTYLLPKEVVIDIVTARNHIVLTMDYDKTEINTPQEIYFVIPEEYGECSTKK
ncbi:DUF4292 domain-containing protein [Fluviicola taffensis]|uniref:DUF4292 domain-containing protein n=1 Tax=Fluviicola taffensis (strain DSM 16823 / NCIMB 13979 / RW262) TaxID=755732 RepID=F2IG03_FLUTR|nr:DUF4292 domain-containing protein [Fluviicola taffensis]AEA43624.1 hypothetical protein Fluta_1632 [Fluviicola taffensis DSM 16823]